MNRRQITGGDPIANDGVNPNSPARADRDRITSADPTAVARSICLSQLTRGPRTRAQLAETLRKRLVPDAAASDVLDRFAQVGLIDDAAFATGWVESRRASRGLASRALARELRDRGIDDDVAESALATLDGEDEESTARALANKRLRSMKQLPLETRIRRTVAMLGRKGYPSSLAYRVVRSELEELDADTDAIAGQITIS